LSPEPASAPAGAIEPPDGIEWTYDPWVERPAVAVVAALAVLAMWLLIASARFPWLLAVALAAIAGAPLAPAFLPAACRVGREGAERRGLFLRARRDWRDVRRVQDVPVGVLLSPYSTRHALDATRALTLPMPAPRRTDLRARVRAAWGRHDRG
jgi:hypothetical protein